MGKQFLMQQPVLPRRRHDRALPTPNRATELPAQATPLLHSMPSVLGSAAHWVARAAPPAPLTTTWEPPGPLVLAA